MRGDAEQRGTDAGGGGAALESVDADVAPAVGGSGVEFQRDAAGDAVPVGEALFGGCAAGFESDCFPAGVFGAECVYQGVSGVGGGGSDEV